MKIGGEVGGEAMTKREKIVETLLRTMNQTGTFSKATNSRDFYFCKNHQGFTSTTFCLFETPFSLKASIEK